MKYIHAESYRDVKNMLGFTGLFIFKFYYTRHIIFNLVFYSNLSSYLFNNCTIKTLFPFCLFVLETQLFLVKCIIALVNSL